MLSDRCPVLSVLSVTLVYCGQTVGRIKTKLGVWVGLGPGHIVLDGTQLPLPQRDTAPQLWPHYARVGPSAPHSKKGEHSPQLSAHVCCGQTARWIKILFGTKVGLGPGHIVLDGDPAHPRKGHSPQLSAHVYCGQTVAHLSYC